MPRAIPLSSKLFRGHKAVKQRQLLAQSSYGALNDLRVHPKNIHGPPFLAESEPGGPSTLLGDLYSVWHFNIDSGANYPADFGAFNFGEFGTLTVEAGLLDNAVRINAGEALLTTPENFAVDENSIFTFSLWIKIALLNPSTHADLISKASGGEGYILRVARDAGSNFTYTFFSGNGSAYEGVGAGLNFTAGVWHHIICGRDADKAYIRVSTQSEFNSLQEVAAPVFTSSAQNFAMPLVPGHTLDCLIDEFISWKDKFLSNAEQEELWNNGNGKAWPFS